MHELAMDALIVLLVVATMMLGWTATDAVVRRHDASDGGRPPLGPGRGSGVRSGALVVEHLAQGVLDLHEVRLVGHDDIDVLVRRRVLVEQLPRLVRVPGPT